MEVKFKGDYVRGDGKQIMRYKKIATTYLLESNKCFCKKSKEEEEEFKAQAAKAAEELKEQLKVEAENKLATLEALQEAQMFFSVAGKLVPHPVIRIGSNTASLLLKLAEFAI